MLQMIFLEHSLFRIETKINCCDLLSSYEMNRSNSVLGSLDNDDVEDDT